MYGLLGLLPTSGENVMSIAPLEIFLLRKMVTCSILILPAVYIYLCVCVNTNDDIYICVYTVRVCVCVGRWPPRLPGFVSR